MPSLLLELRNRVGPALRVGSNAEAQGDSDESLCASVPLGKDSANVARRSGLMDQRRRRSSSIAWRSLREADLSRRSMHSSSASAESIAGKSLLQSARSM